MAETTQDYMMITKASAAFNSVSPTPGTPMGHALDRLQHQVKALHEKIGYIEERIAPVLGPSEPKTPTATPPGESPTPSPLVGELHEKASAIFSACHRLDKLLDRIVL